jgi:hypothetical protein
MTNELTALPNLPESGLFLSEEPIRRATNRLEDLRNNGSGKNRLEHGLRDDGATP